MIGFVTWPPYKIQKGGQVTKPIIVVKVPCKLLYVIQVKEFLIKCSTSWPYLISEFLVAHITIVASDWHHTFFTPKVFLFSIKYCIILPVTSADCNNHTASLKYLQLGVVYVNSWELKLVVHQ